ncbi:MAG TPA: hypothetical protein VGY91_12595 [Chthoniobacterales bacterium]|jgi:hypothetical protein|nr:hypothetical protein [Chthoniobacterales bacterium]
MNAERIKAAALENMLVDRSVIQGQNNTRSALTANNIPWNDSRVLKEISTVPFFLARIAPNAA